MKLRSTWKLWHHSLHDDRWDMSSYIQIHRLETLQDALEMLHVLRESSEHWGHLFLMRDGIRPIYEDPQHSAGGCWSFKIHQRRRLVDAWCFFVQGMLGDLLIDSSASDEALQLITGISLNPRNGVLKVWVRQPVAQFPFANIGPWLQSDRAIFQPHSQRIRATPTV